MKKASQILLLIGGIVAILLVVLWAVLGVIYFVYGGVASVVSGISKGNVDASMVETVANWMKAHGLNPNSLADWETATSTCFAYAVVLLIMSVFAIPAAVLCFVGRKPSAGLGLLITVTVLNILGGAPIGVVGGVLGIVDAAMKKNKQAE